MISEITPEISPANPQIYNSEEVAKLYQDFFYCYLEDKDEFKKKSKEKFSEICKAFKTKCGFDDTTSLDLVLEKNVKVLNVKFQSVKQHVNPLLVFFVYVKSTTLRQPRKLEASAFIRKLRFSRNFAFAKPVLSVRNL